MLEEVRGTVGLVSLSPGTGIDPDADGRRLREGRVLGRDLVADRSEGHSEVVIEAN